MNELEKARIKINEVDQKMVELFIERMNAVQSVIAYKLKHDLPILNEKRELEVIERNLSYVSDIELKPYYRQFITETMAISRQYQQSFLVKHKVGFQGTIGAFSHTALLNLFPNEEAIAYESFESLIQAVSKDEIAYGVVPFENSFTGEVGEVLDILYQYDVYIQAVYNLKVTQNLLGIQGSKIEDIKQVYSHPQAIKQCHTFLQGRKIEVIPYGNTALAAKYIHECNDKTKAAIAAKETAELYSLTILAEHINTVSDNTTKFIVISKTLPTQGNRFSVLFTLKHESGQLARIMQHIGEKGFNLESIKSRSLQSTAWKYYFYLEIDGNIKEEKTQNLIQDLKDMCEQFKIIGVYSV